jgi:hypothetical protein
MLSKNQVRKQEITNLLVEGLIASLIFTFKGMDLLEKLSFNLGCLQLEFLQGLKTPLDHSWE